MIKRKRIYPTYDVKYIAHDDKTVFSIHKVVKSKHPNRVEIIMSNCRLCNYSPVTRRVSQNIGCEMVNVLEFTLNLFWLNHLDKEYGIFIDIPQG